MNLIKLIIALSLFCFSAFADDSTSFDKKPICLKEGGNWRKFASGCVDSCESKFNTMSFCSDAITFGCDCGEDSCYHEDKCIKTADYKKVYDEKQQKEKDELEKLRRERLEKFNKDPSYSYKMHNLYVIPRPEEGKDGKKSKKNNSSSQQQIASQPNVQQPSSQKDNSQLIRKIPPAYSQKNIQPPVNSNGEPQDLVFPVVPLRE